MLLNNSVGTHTSRSRQVSLTAVVVAVRNVAAFASCAVKAPAVEGTL